MNNFEILVKRLNELKKTISTMESCTGGYLANSITNINDSSDIFKFGAVTYSNEYKIKMGVDSEVIYRYTVYSEETAIEMSEAISKFTNSDYSVGITGQLNKQDDDNPYGEVGQVFISIYEKDTETHNTFIIEANKTTREENKQLIVDFVCEKLLEIIQ